MIDTIENMEVQEIDLPEEWDRAYLVPISDTHIGDKRFAEDKLQGYIDWILEHDNAFTVLNGDILDVAIEGSVGNTYDAEMHTQEAMEYAVELFEPLADANRIWGMTEGNHERRISKKTSVHPMWWLSQQLNAPYRPEGMFFKIKLGQGANGKKVCYTAYFTHGTGGGRTRSGKSKKLEYLNEVILADIYSIGHIHLMDTFQDVIFVPDLYNNNIRKMKRTYVSSGSYLGYGGYAERKLYSPNKLGSPRIRLDGEKKDVHVSI